MEILALRAGLGLAVMASLAATRAELRATINIQHLPLHLFRNAVHVGSSYLWAMSLLLIPMAMTFALEFTTPAWTLLIAAPVLGERFTASRVGAVVFGLLGVLVILRPGLAAFQPGALLVLMAAFGFAVTLVATKKLTRTDSPFAHHLLDDADPVAARLDRLRSAVPDQAQSGTDPRRHRHRRVGPGIALLPHQCVPGSGDAGVVVPLDFMRIPLIAVIGWWLYGEPLDVFVFLGAGLIITGILWNLRSEARRAFEPTEPVLGKTG